MNINRLSKNTLIQIIEDLQAEPVQDTNGRLYNQLQEAAKLGAVYMRAIKEHRKAYVEGRVEGCLCDRELWKTIEDNK